MRPTKIIALLLLFALPASAQAPGAAARARYVDPFVGTGGTVAQLKTFYTAMYHLMLAPNLFTDVDGRYRGRDMKVHTARGFDVYTVFSLWDTFRAAHPLYTIIERRRTRDFILHSSSFILESRPPSRSGYRLRGLRP